MSLTLPEKLLRAAKCNSSVFIETGTYYGAGVALAIKCGFKEIWSIEVDPVKQSRAQETFLCWKPDVHLVLGDTLGVLPGLLQELGDRQAVLFLDAHPIDTGKLGPIAAPILQELELLAKAPRRDHTLLIDDRCLFEKHFGCTDQQVEDAIRKINPGYRIWYEDNLKVPNDITVAMV